MTGQKMKKIILLAIIAIAFLQGQAQKEMNWWYFGSNAGLNFNSMKTAISTTGISTTNLPTPVTGSLNTWEGCFSISDINGNFLMASDGMTVYNKNNAIMDNGTGLLGHNSAAQSGIVVPFPGSEYKFYILSVDYGSGTNGISYSIVDLSLNGGLGKVITKNISLLKTGYTYENIAAVSHSNGTDYWIIHQKGTTFYVWKLSASGFSAPQTYTFPLATCGTSGEALAGKLTFSSDNRKLISCLYLCNSITTASFDPSTGVVSDAKQRTGLVWAYGAEFSPSGEYIYIGSLSYNTYKAKYNDFRSGAALSSLGLTVDNLQIGPDKRIYGIKRSTRELYVIMDPDNGGTDVRVFSNYLLTNAGIGLPTFMASFFNAKAKEKSFVCTDNDFRYTVEINMSGAASDQPTKLVWDFGDGSTPATQNIVASQTTYKQTHNYTLTGKYTVTITPYKANGTALSPVTFPANVVDCVFKTNRMIRTDLQNTAIKATNR